VFDTVSGREISFDTMIDEVQVKSDVVFVGELHDDVITHQLEFSIAQSLVKRDPRWNLSMEMFERDVQLYIDSYLAGFISESYMLKKSRPWNNYATDYRPLVELARENKLDVVAANIPRRYAAMITRQGWDEIEKLPREQRRNIAGRLTVIEDRYYTKFIETMSANMGGRAGGPELEQMLKRYYEAQCAKDDTMAESILFYLKKNPGKKIIHFNGQFHSDEYLGTVQKLDMMSDSLSITVISIQPLGIPEDFQLSEKDRKRGDYVIYCRRQAGNDSSPKSKMFKQQTSQEKE